MSKHDDCGTKVEESVPICDVPAETLEKLISATPAPPDKSKEASKEEVVTVFSDAESDCELFASDDSVCRNATKQTWYKFKWKSEFCDRDLFNLGRDLGTRDYIGQRVLQVATILRNLTFIEENLNVLVKNQTFIRFMLLCTCSNWSQLQNLGIDMLGNMSAEFIVREPSTDKLAYFMLKIVTKGLLSDDRNYCISSLDILNKLSQNEANEDILARCLEPCVYEKVCSFLTIHDVMLLIYTLECLYSLSSLGDKPCNYIVAKHSVIDTLVSLVTVEGKSYGPKACIGMKLVETMPANSTATSTAVPTPSVSPAPSTTVSPSVTSSATTMTTVATPVQATPKIAVSVSTPQRQVQVVPQRLIAISPTPTIPGIILYSAFVFLCYTIIIFILKNILLKNSCTEKLIHIKPNLS